MKPYEDTVFYFWWIWKGSFSPLGKVLGTNSDTRALHAPCHRSNKGPVLQTARILLTFEYECNKGCRRDYYRYSAPNPSQITSLESWPDHMCTFFSDRNCFLFYDEGEQNGGGHNSGERRGRWHRRDYEDFQANARQVFKNFRLIEQQIITHDWRFNTCTALHTAQI